MTKTLTRKLFAMGEFNTITVKIINEKIFVWFIRFSLKDRETILLMD